QHIGNYIQYFLAGILLADVYVVSWKNKPAPARWGDLVWLAGWPLLAWVLWILEYDKPAQHPWAHMAFPAMILVLYLSLFKSTIARRLMSLPIIATIGGMCYSIYLLHLHVILVIGKVFNRTILSL